MYDVEKDSSEIFSSLADAGFSLKLRFISALDKFLGMPPLPFLWVETNADIASLARFVANLRFPGVEIADAAADCASGTCYFHCIESIEDNENHSPAHPLLSFAYNIRTRHYEDPLGVYPLIKKIRDIKENRRAIHEEAAGANNKPVLFESRRLFSRYRAIMDTALLLARFGSSDIIFGCPIKQLCERLKAGPRENAPASEAQRAFLSCLLLSQRPDLGLEILKGTGFLAELWPLLAALNEVDHSKEFHPEGNVWDHTLETFRHRKAAASGAFDLRLSFALLLHDCGKPAAAASSSRPFDGHAQLGAAAAARFLERLGFPAPFTEDVSFLVRNHMLPAAIRRLPIGKTQEIMSSPLFPSLMELYRCDESAAFKGLDVYYENSAVYQTYLKNVRNPYRSVSGKKMRK